MGFDPCRIEDEFGAPAPTPGPRHFLTPDLSDVTASAEIPPSFGHGE
jgi:hypothetical protein